MVHTKAVQACLLVLLCSGTALAKSSRWERVLQAGADATVAQAPAAPAISSGPLVGARCLNTCDPQALDRHEDMSHQQWCTMVVLCDRSCAPAR